MTNISKDLRKKLSGEFMMTALETKAKFVAQDGTNKYLLSLEDKNTIESVFIPEAKRKTLCVSTQVGCPLGCKFCATGLLGYKRNLQAYEIADQVRIVQDDHEKITNIVFMGMGEPLLNIKAVVAGVEIISSPIGLSVSQRRTTISTVGLVDGIHFLLESPLKVKLAISLNFADEELRKEMMPIANSNPLKEILKLAHAYSQKKSLVTFEYVMIDGINDRLKDAQRLLRLLKGIPSKINLIPYNPFPRLPYQTPNVEKMQEFHQYLLASPHAITLRKSRGQEIFAGCGQLAGMK